jgi:zinc transporter 10
MGDHCEKSIFVFGMISITIISLTSLTGAVLAPLRSWKYYADVQSGMVALAVGCLSGDAVLHLIPIIFGLHNHDHGAHAGHDEHDHHDHHDHDEHEEHDGDALSPDVVTQRGMMILTGIYIFYLFETSIGLIQHYQASKKQTKNTPQSLSSRNERQIIYASPLKSPPTKLACRPWASSGEICASTLGQKLSVIETDCEANRPCFKEECAPEDDVVNDDEIENGNDEKITEKLISNGHGHSHGHSHGHGDIAMVGWMVIFGDGLHNFADGLGRKCNSPKIEFVPKRARLHQRFSLAIGAAFSASYSTGLGTVFAVFFHELPHEMGDFAVLLGSGMTVKQAMFWNLMSSFTCFIGFFGGVILADSKEMQIFILGIAAGAFIYIALVDMLPEIRINSIHQIKSTARRFCVHQVGLLTGVAIMWLMAAYEDKLLHYFQ